MGKSDIATGGWRTVVSTGPPSTSDIALAGVGTALLMFLFGMAMTAGPADAAVIGVLYGVLVAAVLSVIALLMLADRWVRYHE